jgi:hypothetical protein
MITEGQVLIVALESGLAGFLLALLIMLIVWSNNQ